MMQQLILLGTFFVLPVYLQVVLGPQRVRHRQAAVPDVGDDVHRGDGGAAARGELRAQARRAGRACSRWRPRRFLLLGTIDVELDEAGFAIALALFGVGAGLLLSQLGNVIMSSVDPSKTNEAGGLQGTAQNLGASLGTALIGAVLIAALTSGFVDAHRAEPRGARARRREQVDAGRREGDPGRAGRPGQRPR